MSTLAVAGVTPRARTPLLLVAHGSLRSRERGRSLVKITFQTPGPTWMVTLVAAQRLDEARPFEFFDEG